METLEITKVAAIKAHQGAKKSGKKLLENLLGKKVFLKEVTERIKSFDDVLHELKIDERHFEESCAGLTTDEVAYKKVKLIAKVLNEGWTPDWTDNSEYKYEPWFKMGSPSGVGFSYDDCVSWYSRSHVGSRLCYKSSALAKYAGTQFEDIYKEFLTI